MKIDKPLTDPIERKIALIRAGKVQAEIARKLKVSPVIVTNVMKDRRTSRRVMMAVAEALGKRVEDLWPSGPSKKAA